MYILFQLLTCILLNYYASINCKRTAERYLEHPYTPVYDMIHKYAPSINTHVPDYLIITTCFCTYIKYLYFSSSHFDANVACVFYSLLLRFITTQVTIIPTCMPRPQLTYNLYSKLFASTHDLIYSGHTIVFIFLGKMIDDNYNIYLKISSNIVQFIFPITLILARQHYTIDVIISIIVYDYFYQYNLSFI